MCFCRYNNAIRWFSLSKEINLCGHGTLAAGAMIFGLRADTEQSIQFVSPHSDISIEKVNGCFAMKMPRWLTDITENYGHVCHQLNVQPIDILKTWNLIFVLPNEAEVKSLVLILMSLNRSKITTH